VSRVHGVRPTGLRTSLNEHRSSEDVRLSFYEAKGYFISNLERGSHDGPLGFNEPAV
jgi:hypothetical protein